jgi:DNA-binding beta-propeller fold protein YncE
MRSFYSFLLILCFGLAVHGQNISKKPITLPGVEPDGGVRLPNSWSIKPAGKQIELGDFPISMDLHGGYAAILHAGYGTHEIVVVDLKKGKERIRSRVTLDQTFGGICFSTDGRDLYVGGGEFDTVLAFDFGDGLLARQRSFKVADAKFIPGALTVNGDLIFVPGVFGHAVAFGSEPANAKYLVNRTHVSTGKDSYPFACLVDGRNERLYVSLWNKAAVAVIDVKQRAIVQTIATEKHPTEMAFGPKEKTLYVACSNSTRVSVIDLKEGKSIETINCALYANAPNGNTPNSLCLTPDGKILFVANADNNNVAVFNVEKPGDSKPMGFIPVGMYPTCVRYDEANKRILVLNGRGTSVKANPQGPNPHLPKNPSVRQYIAGLYRGTLSIINMPDEEQMAKYSKQAYQCSPLRPDQGVVGKIPDGNPIPAKIGAQSPLKYCFYIIRENRTYDQVFGDIKGGNGDPSLCIFPDKVTPNAHRIAKQFVLLDNFYCDGEVSAEGHEWAMGAYCTDFVKRVWPLSYRGSPTKNLKIYPAEGIFDDIARPAGGYIWDRCADANVSYRSYGEWVANGKTLKDPMTARVKALEGHIDPHYRGYDLDYSDLDRAKRFISELERFEKAGDMPKLSIIRIGNDHTYGTRAGKPTPTAMVAQNDLALGMIVEAISKSKFWKESAIFVIEDDAQNGSDHVDAHRTVALCVSPDTQHGKVDSTMYSTSSMLRTMELILGLRPMSQFDAAATPMYAAFQKEPRLDAYAHVMPDVDMKAVNSKKAFGAALAETWDFTKEDQIDDLIFNEVIWRSVKGAYSPMPPPVRAAFVFPHLPPEEKKTPKK